MGDYSIVSFDGLTFPDINKLKQLSPEAFRDYYIGKMRRYPWWEKGETRNCGECGKPINTPEELRRYNGINLHPVCFSIVRSHRKDSEDPETKEYFDMVEKLVPVS